MNNIIKEKATKIKLLILDVDGVLTDATIHLTETGTEHKLFNSRDGIGIRLLIKSGVEIAIISGRESKAVNYRLEPLGVKHIYQNQGDKRQAYEKLKQLYNLTDTEIAYMGDDLPDLPVMQQVGFSIAVANADDFVKAHVDHITVTRGGRGAVREVCELILQAQDKLLQARQQFLTYK